MTLKAYIVTEIIDNDYNIVFSSSEAQALEKGMSVLNTETDDVVCLRAPELDQYAPGPVPAITLIQHHGWNFECCHCGCNVSSDDDLRPNGVYLVFCSESCECADHMAKRGKAEAREALLEVFEAKFPGAKVESLHVYDGQLHAGKAGYYRVLFSFPGAQYLSSWDFGASACSVPMVDHEAFKTWMRIRP